MNAAKPNLKVSLSESMFERIPFDYEKSELTGYSNYSYWHSTFRTFFKQRSSTVLLGILRAFVAEVRVPYQVRAHISRPMLSVPNQCSLQGERFHMALPVWAKFGLR